MSALPTLFISHGSPLHAVQTSAATEGWRALAQRLLKPRAVLMASAHWETDVPEVSLAAQPQTIHDFGGFPEALYRITYPTPGAPEVARAALSSLQQAGIEAQAHHERGLDHGAWVPLRYLYPEADVPVAQISIQSSRDAAHHLQVGRALAPMAQDGVLIIGSGHVTHNLREFFTQAQAPSQLQSQSTTAPYVKEFSDWVANALTTHDEDALKQWQQQAPHAQRAHPTPEHFLPLLLAYGAADAQTRVERIDLGVEGGVLAMDAYVFWPRTA